MEPELIAFLDIANVHRLRAAEVRILGRDAADPTSRRNFEILAAKLETQASRLEAHATRLQTLSDQTDRLTAELKKEIDQARNTVVQIKKALLPD